MTVYEQIVQFYESYRGVKCVYGKSVSGRELYAIHTGSLSGAQGISQYGIHGREWITGLLSLYHIRRGVPYGGVWILPLTNPDGATLSQCGASSVSEDRREKLIKINGGNDFSHWKANANAVDLNVNFDARWGKGAQNVKQESFANYVGTAPFSESESAALRDFTLKIAPRYTVSWHTKGEEIYWEFHQPVARRMRDKQLAQALSKSTGYPLVTVKNSVGGYKDWCIEKLRIPSFTVEVGRDALAHPLGENVLPEIVASVADALSALSRVLERK